MVGATSRVLPLKRVFFVIFVTVVRRQDKGREGPSAEQSQLNTVFFRSLPEAAVRSVRLCR